MASPVILASASPRRRDLLGHLGIDFTVVASNVDEPEPGEIPAPSDYARELARAKAQTIAADRPESAVLAADTIVVLDGRVLGKPADADDARRTLTALREREHQVTTAVAVVHEQDVRLGHVTSDILMRGYTDQEIMDYIASGDPFDKAGSYAIQDSQFHPVERCEGCYCNVVGLPILLVHQMLRETGVRVADLHALSLPLECGTCPLAGAAGMAGGES